MKNKLKEYRKLNHYTQKQLAAILQITQAEYSRIENNQRDITVKHLVILKNLYKCKLDDLISE